MNEPISFIVPMYNEERHIAGCIRSILKEMKEGDEILVVDNGSTDESVKVAGAFEGVRVLTLPGKTISAVRNFGAKHSEGSILAFLDADCLLSPGWRNGVVKVLSDNSVASTGSKCDIPDNAHWIEKAWSSQRPKKPGKVRYINSGNFVVRKSVFEKMGGFSEDLITGEDAELGWRITKSGFHIVEDPEVRAVHLGNPKTFLQFYKRERWHGKGMPGTFKISFWDKPLLMTVAFLISSLVAFFSFPMLIRSVTGRLILIGLPGWVPVTTTLYRAFQYRSLSYLPQWVILYFIYFTARSHSLIDLLRSARKTEKPLPVEAEEVR